MAAPGLATEATLQQLVTAQGGGSATAANQVTEIAKLTSIDEKTPALVGGSTPVAIDTATLNLLPDRAEQVLGVERLISIDEKTPALISERMPVDGSGVTQPVSAESLPLPTGASTSAAQTDGTQKAIARGGAKGASVAADVTSTANGADHQGLDVVEQFQPLAEDNTNGVYGVTRKLIAANTYAATLATDFGVATKANIKASAGNVLAVRVSNNNAAARFFQLHNKSTAPVATDVPLYSFFVPLTSAIEIGEDFFVGSGGAFTLGVGWAWSTTAGTFTDAATAADHTTHIHYK